MPDVDAKEAGVSGEESVRASDGEIRCAHDLALFSSVAFASLMSGQVLEAFGWTMLNWVLIPGAAFCLATLLMQVLADRRVALAQQR